MELLKAPVPSLGLVARRLLDLAQEPELYQLYLLVVPRRVQSPIVHFRRHRLVVRVVRSPTVLEAWFLVLSPRHDFFIFMTLRGYMKIIYNAWI